MAKIKLFIDLGHYAKVPGAKGEIEWTRRIASFIEAKINKTFLDVVWVPTFENLAASSQNLNARTRFIRENSTSSNDMLLSIHANSSGDPSANGVETFYALGKPASKAMELEAVRLSKVYSEKTGTKVRGTGAKSDNQSQHSRLAMLQDTIPKALLLEAGFASNAKDMSVNPELAAAAIADFYNSPFLNSTMPPQDQELDKYVKRFVDRGVIKSANNLDLPTKKSETILILGRNDDFWQSKFDELEKRINTN